MDGRAGICACPVVAGTAVSGAVFGSVTANLLIFGETDKACSRFL